MSDDNLQLEADAFDRQIRRRIEGGHIPDLRRAGKCEYFYNNVWRDQEFAGLSFGALVERVLSDIGQHLPAERSRQPSVLEVGCGPGHICLELARNGMDMVGLDISAACIEIAKKTAADDPWASQRGSLEYVREDFLSHDGRYDVVLFAASLHHFPDCLQAVRHAGELLRDDGIIIVNEPLRDLVSDRNAAVILLIKGLLAGAGGYFSDEPFQIDAAKAEELRQKIYREEKYKLEDGSQTQSVNDNEAGYREIRAALDTCFEEVAFELKYGFFHQIIGGLRLESRDKEIEVAKFLKIMDAMLCQYGAIDPTNCHYVGRKIVCESGS